VVAAGEGEERFEVKRNDGGEHPFSAYTRPMYSGSRAWTDDLSFEARCFKSCLNHLHSETFQSL
jgi:hypothetical protein